MKSCGLGREIPRLLSTMKSKIPVSLPGLVMAEQVNMVMKRDFNLISLFKRYYVLSFNKNKMNVLSEMTI